jgi:nucleotide-binding universal stress UspA family protein
MSALAGQLEGIPVVLVIDKGCPATRILAYAGEVGAELIVLGAHGRHSTPAAPLGNVAEEVSRRAACPVLTVRGGAARAAPRAPALRA